ncbi:MAG TPA: aromatic ring hydroxylase [Clostridiales bacterium]|nr:aromatic ring hydroxylase [Clostridiales bacterium]
MRTAEEYLEKLRSMRRNVHLNGELVDRDHPEIMPGIRVISETFKTDDPALRGTATAVSHLTGKTINRFCHIHRTTDDLLAKQKMTRLFCRRTGGCIQRCMGVDALNALSVVTKACDDAMGTEYHDRFNAYLEWFQENDLVGNAAQTDVKGDRSKRPHEQVDPDLYVRVVEKKKDGIVVRGAKAHNTIGPYCDEIIVLPTRLMTPEDRDWSVAFAVPADAEGVHQFVRATHPRPRRFLKAPAAEFGACDSLTVFDDVFVPWERVFLCGETMYAGQLAALFATYHRHSYTGCKAAVSDIIVGAAALVAEYNGVTKAPHVRDKLAELVAVGELVYAAGIAASVNAQPSSSGTMVPDIVFTNVGRYHAGVNVMHEFEILIDLAGGLPATLPPEDEWADPESARFLEKYIMRNPDVSAENQHRCFRFLSDMLCSSNSGVMQVAGIHGGGSPIMEKIAITGLYDFEEKKAIVRHLAGITS